MTGMNRLSPLIVRRVGPAAAAAAGALPAASDGAESAGSDDLRLFATAWLGGFVFLATFLA